MEYNFGVRTFLFDFDNPEDNGKTTREKHTWDFDEFMNFVTENRLILSYMSCHEHVLFNPPYIQYNFTFSRPVNKRKAYLYDLTLSGWLTESDCKEFESELSDTELFKTYKAKRIMQRKNIIPKYQKGF